ncbi:olfactory receptor class A-like protein 1 [Protopterus annectens]|uniref:olfactory receptor class A-like protein 1 n=1 Tax=Protopterus annectens TaxID=7888 RepID=UPI001CFAB897|nr:olfactory receptor class A-like protein 1 [Protopterus annectens]
MNAQEIKGVIFFLTTVIGIFGNAIILVFMIYIALQEKKMMHSEVILSSLACSNLIHLLTVGLPHSLYPFGIIYFYTDLDCKSDVYLMRVSRVMIIGLTCLLSCFQCVTLASLNPQWATLKLKMQKYLILLILIVCLISLASSINSALYPVTGRNATNLKYTFNLGYCLSIYPDKLVFELTGFISFARDVAFVVLMALASAHILLILHRHGKQMKGKRSSDRSQEAGVEQQASKMVVAFVVTYVSLFGIENTIWFYQISVSKQGDPSYNDSRYFLSFCFSSLFPIILAAYNQKLRHRIICYKC